MQEENRTGAATQGMNYILHIQSAFDSMPRSYQKIARFILQHPDSVSSASITQMAKKLGICTSTITRFSQSLGFSGYSHLKHAIGNASFLPLHEGEEILPHDSGTVIKQKLLPRYIQSIESVMEIVSPDKLDYIATVIPHASKVYFFSHGGSGVSAVMGQIMFMQIGLPAVAFTDISTANMAAAQMRSGDVAIGISSSGSAKTAIDALRIAQANKALTIGITGFAHTPMAAYSKVMFCYNISQENIRYMHLNRLCETTILGLLQNAILNKNYATMSHSLQTAKGAFMSARLP